MTTEEKKVHAALQIFNNGIKSNRDAKTLIGNLAEQLSQIEPNDKNFRESLEEISKKLGECVKDFGKYKTTYVLSNENTPHYEIFKTVSSDKITETVKDNLKKKEISAIASQKNAFFNVEFPKNGKIDGKNTDEGLEKELAKFVVNLLRKLYPELAPASGATKITKNGNKKAIQKGSNENPSNSSLLISALDDFSRGVLNTVNSKKSSAKSFDEVLSSCVSLVDTLFNDTRNYLKENKEVASVIGKIRKASENFSKQKDVYKGRIHQIASIPTLYKELTGKGVSADDIALAKRGRVVNEIKGLDNGSVFYDPVRKCLSAFMCIYVARDSEKFFKELYDSSSQELLGKGGYGDVYSINKRKNDKRKAVKEFHCKGDFALGAKSAYEVNNAFESDLDKIHQIKQSAKSEGKNHKENEEYKKAKENVNRIALSKVVDGKLVSERAECDLSEFIDEKFPNIIEHNVDEINKIEYTEMKKKKEEYFENVKKGFTQLIEDMKTGVEQFHRAGMCHRDIKPLNFLVFSSKKSKIGYKCKLSDLDTKLDFGDKFEYEFSGTPDYVPRRFFTSGMYKFCKEFGKGKAGCELGRMLDLYALYESMCKITEDIERDYDRGEARKIASDLSDISKSQANALYQRCKEFKMFDSIENMKEFLIDNGSPDKTAMEKYIKGGTSLKKNDNAPQENDNGHPAQNILKSRPNENADGNIFKRRPSRPNGNAAGNIFKRRPRPNESADGNIIKRRPSRPNGNAAERLARTIYPENGADADNNQSSNELLSKNDGVHPAENLAKSRPPKSDD